MRHIPLPLAFALATLAADTPAAGQETSPEVIAEIRARPCPTGFVKTNEEDFKRMNIEPDVFWETAAVIDRMKNDPMFKAQLSAQEDQLRAMARQSGIPVTEDMLVMLRRDPTIIHRCHPPAPTNAVSAPGKPDAMGAAGQAADGLVQGALGSGGGKTAATAGAIAAAAPVAGAAARRIGSLFGRRGPSAESMAKELDKGRLELKDLKFAEDGSELAEGADEILTMAVDALGKVTGRFALYVPAEAEGRDTPPNTDVATQRIERLVARLTAAGVGADRVTGMGRLPEGVGVNKDREPVRRGVARAILIRIAP